jgi:hypothetical protein
MSRLESSSASMVQEAEALEKPGKPTFFEMPAWSFNMGWGLSGFDGRVWKAETNSHPPSGRGIWTAALISPPP